MKRLLLLITVFCLCVPLFGCTAGQHGAQIAATTLPVYEFTSALCEGTDISVTRLITESVSCLHDYTLQVGQMRAIESAQILVLSGAGLEDFMTDSLRGAESIIDASEGIALLCPKEEHDHGHDHGHNHEEDPHIWLSPVNAKIMVQNIYNGLVTACPQYADTFSKNLSALEDKLDALIAYGEENLATLSCRKLITFHDGFGYLADAYGLSIVHAIEEESGSEASAAELIELIGLINEHGLDAIFTERNGSVSAAAVIAAETGAAVFELDMAMSGDSYFDAMYHNIDTLKEALE